MQGMVDLLVPVVQELDQNVLAVRESQIELFREIERLSGGAFQPPHRFPRRARIPRPYPRADRSRPVPHTQSFKSLSSTASCPTSRCT